MMQRREEFGQRSNKLSVRLIVKIVFERKTSIEIFSQSDSSVHALFQGNRVRIFPHIQSRFSHRKLQLNDKIKICFEIDYLVLREEIS